jgi:3'-phosphoadenosine 5'-phosphosulfate sulfotransferase (PAPS reductase)/FAD synthetase
LKDLYKKIQIAENNIGEWYEYWDGNVYVAFSGGKDSLVLLDIVRKLYPDVQAVFVDTGLEYPDVKASALSYNNVARLKPKMSFPAVLKKYGYPIISKDVAQKIMHIRTSTVYIRNLRLTKFINGAGLPVKHHYLVEAPFLISDECCKIMKKKPFVDFERKTNKKPMVGVMASDSIKRKRSWREHGCNGFSMSRPQGRPLMSWDTPDIWAYLKQEKIKYPKIYDLGLQHTGCMFCGFGILFDSCPNRYEMLKIHYPKIYKYVIERLEFNKVLDFIGISY